VIIIHFTKLVDVVLAEGRIRGEGNASVRCSGSDQPGEERAGAGRVGGDSLLARDNRSRANPGNSAASS